MSRWRELAAELAHASEPHETLSKVDIGKAEIIISRVPTAMVSKLTNPDTQDSPPPLPVDLRQNLARLEKLSPPAKLRDRNHWRPIVTDALRLARDGWAAKALALGWTELDLFGVGPRDSWDWESLSVWIEGRRIVLLDAATVIADNGNGRAAFTRPSFARMPAGVLPVPLWAFGRAK